MSNPVQMYTFLAADSKQRRSRRQSKAWAVGAAIPSEVGLHQLLAMW